jgi:hypothetical protein
LTTISMVTTFSRCPSSARHAQRRSDC